MTRLHKKGPKDLFSEWDHFFIMNFSDRASSYTRTAVQAHFDKLNKTHQLKLIDAPLFLRSVEEMEEETKKLYKLVAAGLDENKCRAVLHN